MDKMKKQNIFMFYIILTILLGVAGYFLSKRMNKEPVIGISTGLVAGGIISSMLWVLWGKNNSY